MAHGTHNRSNRPEVIEDLDELIVSRSLRPAKVKFGGRLWTIKRDFTAEQIIEFWRLQDEKTAEAVTASYAMVVGTKDAPAFYEIMTTLPAEMSGPAARRLLQLAGIIKRLEAVESESPELTEAAEPAEGDGEAEGESSAS